MESMSQFSNLNQIGNYDDGINTLRLNNDSYTIDLDGSISTCSDLNQSKRKSVRLIHCSDGIVEECDEDEDERLRLEKEAKEKEIELKDKLDTEAKSMHWLPWVAYMVTKSATKSLEVCDSMGEKLAWWFGITKPKFLYEIEEYNRMKKEQEDFENEDRAEEIVVGVDTVEKKVVESNLSDKNELEMKKLYDSSDLSLVTNESVSTTRLFQNF